MAEKDNRFWQDEFFFESQDPLMRENEKRHHPDTGQRILIVHGRGFDYEAKIAVTEAHLGTEQETNIVYHTSQDIVLN